MKCSSSLITYLCLFPFFNLLAKNVAADIAAQLCDSVASKLQGKVMGTFTSECIFNLFHTLFFINAA